MATNSLAIDYGPWALVTGASSGIGEAFARQLAQAGFNIVVVARREAQLQALKTALEQAHGIEVVVLPLDLSHPASLDQLHAEMARRDIGLIVSNAGFGLKGPFESHEVAVLDAMLNVNARTPMLLLREALPRLKQRPRAGIILTGSIEGEAVFPWSAAYAATKAFVHSLGLGIAGELEDTAVDLLVLEPGSTDTDAPISQGVAREQLAGLMSPDEVAAQALQNLGRKSLHIPGLQNRLFVRLLRWLPRRWSTALTGRAMATVLAKSGHPVK